MTVKKFILQAGFILLLSIIIGVAYNGFSNSPLPLFKKYDINQVLEPGDKTKEDGRLDAIHVSEIDIETLKYLIESETVQLVDARTKDEFELGHIPHAINLPVYEFDRAYKAAANLSLKDKTIISYCSSVTCLDSTLLAKKLYSKGHKDIFVYRGGFEEWVELNNRVEKPSGAIQE